ncbi:MAG: TMEM175 family protein [Massilia sp.]
MGKTRLEAFRDGVIAIIIAIMALELKLPHGATFNGLLPLLPLAGSCIFSFVYVGAHWNKLQYASHPSKFLPQR